MSSRPFLIAMTTSQERAKKIKPPERDQVSIRYPTEKTLFLNRIHPTPHSNCQG
jgi:hypothetical protein